MNPLPALVGVLPEVGVAEFVVALAVGHGVTATRTQLDDFAETVTRMAGDDVRLDAVGQTLVALRERGLVSAQEMNRLMLNHRREIRLV